MVLYHWLNYFVTTDGDIYKYLRFITPSFIFVTGFLVTNVFLGRYRVRDSSLHRRLLVRGIKLVVLFTVLNVAAHLVIHRADGGGQLAVARFVANAASIYVSGDGQGAVFEVLVPIGYLLIVSPLLLWGCKIHRHFPLLVWLASLGVIFALKRSDIVNGNLELLSMGLLGMVVGECRLESLDRAVRRPIAWLGAYAAYLIALSAYNVRFELQVVGLILNMGLLYIMAKTLGSTGLIPTGIIVLGQYSLLAYIAQIVGLQVLTRATHRLDLGAGAYLALLGAALLLTCLAVEATRSIRNRSAFMDGLYRLVFA
jgi:hypothetical protein